MTRFTRRPLLAGTAALLAAPALAQGARRPLRLVVPFPPGGAVDALARIMAERLPALIDQPVVVDNRSGAGGLIGADAVAKGPPDGTILGIIGAATLCAAPFIQATMPFDPARDLRGVSQITNAAVVLVVNGPRAVERGWNDLASTLAWARANPERLRVAHAGVATVSHLVLAALSAASGGVFTQVPYRGGAAATVDVLSGQVDGSADLPTALIPHVREGRLRALGVSSRTRSGIMPDVPPMAETAGLGDIDIRSWNALMVPRATPDAEVERLYAGIRRMATAPDFTAQLLNIGYDAALTDGPAATDAMIAAETPRWRHLVEISGARSG